MSVHHDNVVSSNPLNPYKLGLMNKTAVKVFPNNLKVGPVESIGNLNDSLL